MQYSGVCICVCNNGDSAARVATERAGTTGLR